MISKFKGDGRHQSRLSEVSGGIISGFEELVKVFRDGGKAYQAYSILKAQK